MLKIRKEQNDELAKIALKRFEDSMVEHLREHFPKPAEISGENALRSAIKKGFEHCRKYGFTTEHQICLYIDLTVMLGGDFDTDPQLPWAGRILNRKDFANATGKIDALYDRSLQYLDRVVGKKEVFPVHAMRKVRQYPLAEIEQMFKNDILRDARAFFEIIWPAKCEHVGNIAIEQMLREANKTAGQHGIVALNGIGIYSAFMFLLGHRFDIDPMCPWAGEVLNDSSITSPVEKIKLLHAGAIKVIDQALG